MSWIPEPHPGDGINLNPPGYKGGPTANDYKMALELLLARMGYKLVPIQPQTTRIYCSETDTTFTKPGVGQYP